MAAPAPSSAANGVRYRVKGTRIYMEPFEAAIGGAGGVGAGYDAAGQGWRAHTWRASSAGPNAVLAWSHATLRNRSRSAIRQNAFAESAIAALETNVVGTGIKPQWETGDSGLDRDLAALWRAWTDEADADQRLDWYGLQALALRGTAEAGEVFVRFRARRPGDMDTVPLQLQVLESEFCPTERNQVLPGRQVRNGVEFDARGLRTAYWLYRQHPNDWNFGEIGAVLPIPVPAAEVMHLALPRRAGQIRGEPWLTRALIKLRDLDDYDDAELMRKKTAAMFAAFVRRTDGAGPAGGEAVPGEPGVERAVLEPGTAQYLREGEEVSFSEPADVGGSYQPFMRQQLRAVAVAGGVLYEQLTGDYSQVNDRTFRASVNEFRRRVGMLQHHLMVFQLCRPVARRWAETALIGRAIRLPAGADPAMLRRIKWVPQGFAYIHPVQEVDAQIRAIRAGLKSRSEAISESGYDAADVDREIAADNARADAAGNRYDSDGRYPMSGAAARQPADRAEEEPAPAGEDRETADA